MQNEDGVEKQIISQGNHSGIGKDKHACMPNRFSDRKAKRRYYLEIPGLNDHDFTSNRQICEEFQHFHRIPDSANETRGNAYCGLPEMVW